MMPTEILGEHVELLDDNGAPVGRARVMATNGPWLYVALEPGGYLPSTVEPLFVRPVGADRVSCTARVVHEGQDTATLLVVIDDCREPAETLPEIMVASPAQT